MRFPTLLSLCLIAIGTALALPSLFQNEQICSHDGDDSCEAQAYEYLYYVCMPKNSSGFPDMTAPCNIVSYLEQSCIYGAYGIDNFYCDSISEFNGDNGTDPTSSPYCQAPNAKIRASNEAQRDCICSSQHWEAYYACVDCFNAHGGSVLPANIGPTSIKSSASSYCAATNTPVEGYNQIFDVGLTSTNSAMTTYIDPNFNSTEVALYYTAPVTGSAMLANNEESITISSGASATSGATATISVSTDSNGQIVATAASAGSSAGTATASSPSASSSASSASTSTKSGAGTKETAIVAHVMVAVGVVALL